MSQFILADNVKETASYSGTGPVNLGGAYNSSVRTFVLGMGNGKRTAYKVDNGTGVWENRIGTITAGTPDTISNDVFISSSTGSAITFAAGTKTISCVPLSELVLTPAVCAALVETDIASATTTDLGNLNTFRARITGTTAITGFGSQPNSLRWVRFAGALTLTHNASSLILLNGISRTTQAGATGLYMSDAAGNWRELAYSNPGSGGDGPVLEVSQNSSAAGISVAVNQLGFGAIHKDSHGWWNNTTKRYTPLLAGRYRVVVGCFINGNVGSLAANSSLMELYIRLNGGVFVRKITRSQAAMSGANGWGDVITGDVTLNGSTDYIDAAVYTDGTSMATVGNSGGRSTDTFMQITYLGPLV